MALHEFSIICFFIDYFDCPISFKHLNHVNLVIFVLYLDYRRSFIYKNTYHRILYMTIIVNFRWSLRPTHFLLLSLKVWYLSIKVLITWTCGNLLGFQETRSFFFFFFIWSSLSSLLKLHIAAHAQTIF